MSRIKSIEVKEYRNPDEGREGKLIGLFLHEMTHEGVGTFRFFLTVEEAHELIEKVSAKLNIKAS